VNEDRRCRQCGSRLAADEWLDHQCAACLLALGAWDLPVRVADGRETLLPHLSILNLLGEGPRARAYLAEWKPPGGGFAVVKCSRPGFAAVPLDVADIERLVALDHPHVGTMYEAGVDGHGRRYAITEFIPGVPITRFCDQAQLAAAGRVELTLQVAGAVQHAHALGVAHRNLKPTNVLVVAGQPGAVSVLDFESAMPDMHAAEPEDPGALPGPAGVEDDVRALGILLAELLAGASGERVIELGAIIRQATHPTATRRYQSVSALADDLAAWLGSAAPA
jgi:eukaryotic-like serine/threonine-protein kinase